MACFTYPDCHQILEWGRRFAPQWCFKSCVLHWPAARLLSKPLPDVASQYVIFAHTDSVSTFQSSEEWGIKLRPLSKMLSSSERARGSNLSNVEKYFATLPGHQSNPGSLSTLLFKPSSVTRLKNTLRAHLAQPLIPLQSLYGYPAMKYVAH